MNRISPLNSFPSLPEIHPLPVGMEDVPDDVLPVIFTKLSEPEFFMLPSVSKRFWHATQPAIRDRAAKTLHATLPLSNLNNWKLLLNVFHRSAHQITPAEWERFLKAVDNEGISSVLVQFLLLSPAVAAKNAEIVRITKALPLALDQDDLKLLIHRFESQLDHDFFSVNFDLPFITKIIAGALMHLIHSERAYKSVGPVKKEHLAETPNWMHWEKFVGDLFPLEQASVLSQLGSWSDESESIRHALDNVLAAHLEKLFGHEQKIHFNVLARPYRKTKEQSCLIQQTELWFNMLANAHALRPSTGGKPYIETLFSEQFKNAKNSLKYRHTERYEDLKGNMFLSWHEQMPAVSRCAFLAMTYSLSSGGGKSALREAMVKCDFMTNAEADDFIRKFKKRTSESMPFKEAVDLWMKENQAEPLCTIL